MWRDFKLSSLGLFLDELVAGDGQTDADGLERRYVAGNGWPNAGESFHSEAEAKQSFILECVIGKGLNNLVWPDMGPADVFALADELHDAAAQLGSGLRVEAIRAAIFSALSAAGKDRVGVA